MGHSITYWLGFAFTLTLIIGLIGGGICLIISGSIAMEGAPDMVKGAAAYGTGFATLSFYMGFVSYYRTYNMEKKLKQWEEDRQ